ncbi:MAG: twin-arginine translocase subunit TatC [Phycisphaerae bacterium]|jgi:sec-independent protein translocase protein TatC
MAPPEKKTRREPGDARMTLGEHLDELRTCLVRSLIVLVITALACIWPSKYLLAILTRPVVLALRAHGQPDSLLATSPVESIVVYIKVVLIAALIIAGPVILYQFWSFVAAGLYPKEKAWVYRLVPVSAALFIVGVVFMYLFVLVLSLNFLVGFSDWLRLPDAKPGLYERIVLGLGDDEGATSQPVTPELWPTVPLLTEDPKDPPPGAIWFNVSDNRLKVHERRHDGPRTYSYQFQRDDRRAMVTTHFKIGEYLSFVLVLTIAFGLAFQLPLVVIFLVRSGLVSVQTFRRYRKLVILAIVFIAGCLAPPDLLSHMLLSGPMILLFEIGLFIAARKKRAPAEA